MLILDRPRPIHIPTVKNGMGILGRIPGGGSYRRRRRPVQAEINWTAGCASSSFPHQSAVSNGIKKDTFFKFGWLFIKKALSVPKMGPVRVRIEHKEFITQRTLDCARHLVLSVGLVVIIEDTNTSFLLSNRTFYIGPKMSIPAVTRALYCCNPMHSNVVGFDILPVAERDATSLIRGILVHFLFLSRQFLLKQNNCISIQLGRGGGGKDGLLLQGRANSGWGSRYTRLDIPKQSICVNTCPFKDRDYPFEPNHHFSPTLINNIQI